MKRIRLIRYVWYVGYLALLLCASRVTAQTHTIRQFEAQRRAALREIEQTTQLLNEARASAQTSLNRLHLISQQVIARKKVISLLNQEIAVLDKQIADATRELAVLEKSLNDRKERYAQLVRNLYTRRASQHRLLFVLSADNFAQSLRRMRYLREYASWQKMQALLIVRKQEELDKKREELGQTRTNKVALLDAREEESRKLQQEESEQKAEVQQLNKKEKNLRQKLAQKRRQAEALNRQIEKLIAEEVKSFERKTESRKQRRICHDESRTETFGRLCLEPWSTPLPSQREISYHLHFRRTPTSSSQACAYEQQRYRYPDYERNGSPCRL